MKTYTQPKRLQFSKLPLSTGRVLEEKKSFQNQSTHSLLTPCSSAKRVTFGARVTNLSSSSVSMLSSKSSLSYASSNLTLSRTSLDSQRMISNENRQSFSQLRMFEKIQPFKNDQNQPPGLTLIRKTQSNYEQGYDHLNSSRLLEKYRVKPVLEQSMVLEMPTQPSQLPTVPELFSPPKPSVDSRLEQLENQIKQQDQEILNLRTQIQTKNQSFEKQLNQKKQVQVSLQHTIQQLNLIIFQLRNTKEYQKQIISMLQEKERSMNFQKQSLLTQNQIFKQDKYQLWEHNRSLQILIQSYEQKQESSQSLANEITNSLDYKNKIIQLQKSLNLQTNILKNVRLDLKKRDEKIEQLQEFIDQSNAQLIKDQLATFNNYMIKLEAEEEKEQNRYLLESLEYVS